MSAPVITDAVAPYFDDGQVTLYRGQRSTVARELSSGSGVCGRDRRGCSCGATPLADISAAVMTVLGMIIVMVGATAVAQSARPADVYVAPGPSHAVCCQTCWDAGGCWVPRIVIGVVTTAVGADAR